MAMFQIIGPVGMWTQGAQEKEWESSFNQAWHRRQWDIPLGRFLEVGQQSMNENELKHLALAPLRNIEN
jgi:hypothetical protein